MCLFCAEAGAFAGGCAARSTAGCYGVLTPIAGAPLCLCRAPFSLPCNTCSQLHEHFYEVPAPIRQYIQEVKAQLAVLTGVASVHLHARRACWRGEGGQGMPPQQSKNSTQHNETGAPALNRWDLFAVLVAVAAMLSSVSSLRADQTAASKPREHDDHTPPTNQTTHNNHNKKTNQTN